MKICEAGRSSGCCSNPNIRTINTMNADTVGNFTIRGEQGIHVRVGTNEIIISGIAVYYDNTDGNIVVDNDLMTVNLADDITIMGDMIIAGDLTVNGTYYTVHAEHVYTQDDYIILREGATTPLAAGSYAGFQVTKYDGTNDGRLVIDNSGVARVGDVGDEQPLLTRSESASLTNGNLLQWNGTSQKAVDAGVNTSQIVRGSGNIGDDTKPVKVVNGVATAVTNALQTALTVEDITSQVTINSAVTGNIKVTRYGKIVIISFEGVTIGALPNDTQIITGLPLAKTMASMEPKNWAATTTSGILLVIYPNNTTVTKYSTNTVNSAYGNIIYISE